MSKPEPTDLHAGVIFDEDDVIAPLVGPNSIPARVALAPDLMSVLINVGSAHGVTVGSIVRVMEHPQMVHDPENLTNRITLQRNNGFYRVDVAKRNFCLCSLIQITNRTHTIAAGDPCWVNPETPQQQPDLPTLVHPGTNRVM